jgi:hypothetical protein
MKKIYKVQRTVFAIFGLALSMNMGAQCFSCGTGADGVYHATTNTTLTGGTYNYTSFSIDSGDTVTITGTNPLVIHSTGAVQIDGTLLANGGNGNDGVTSSNGGIGGIGVAGGGNGGDGSFSSSTGPINGNSGNGMGMGGMGGGWSGGGGAGYETGADSSGNVLGGFGGPAYGNTQLNPLLPGSGGGGGSGGYNCGAGGGGAGGGVIQIESCVSLTIGATGLISANGGNGGSDGTGNCGGGGGGSGGTIWLMTSGTLSNSGTISATPGTGGASAVPGNPYYGTGTSGKNGRIRFDYTTLAGSGSVTPLAGFTAAVLTASNAHTDETTIGANDGSATVTESGGTLPYSYLWSPGNQTSSSITGLTAGTYTCTTTDANGCTTVSTIVIGTITGISTINNQSFTADLFPNPANDHLQLNVNNAQKEKLILEVYNVVGEKIDAVDFGTVSNVNQAYSTAALTNGVYFFRISSGENTITRKVTVAH